MNHQMTSSQLTNRRAEIAEAIEWNEQKYPVATRSDAQQGFIDQLIKDAEAIEQEQTRRIVK